MDLIYSHAEATIVSACGADPSYGLPGVSDAHRIPQGRLEFRDYLLVSTLPDPADQIRKSVWMSRGWTYQEALLSRRRLIFTDHQVYYECYGMYCCEARNTDLLALHVENRQRFTLAELDACIFPRFGAGFYIRDVLRCISEYSARSLTYQSDILNGILGVLRAFEDSMFKEERERITVHESRLTTAAALGRLRALDVSTGPLRVAKDPVRHLWGVPIFPSGMTFRRSLDGFICGLFWTLASPGNRRSEFPSWSWSGWTGNVEWRAIDFTSLRSGTCKEILWGPFRFRGGVEVGIKIETNDGCLLDWKTFHPSNGRNKLSRECSRFIHIEASTVPIRLTLKSDQLEPSKFADIEVHCSCAQQGWLPVGMLDRTLQLPNRSTFEEFLEKDYTGVLLGITPKRTGILPTYKILVLIVDGDEECAERIGYCEPPYGILEKLEKTKQVIRLG